MVAAWRPVVSRVVLGLVLAAGLGALEMSLAAAGAMNASVARRAPALLLYAALLSGVLGAAVALAAELLRSAARLVSLRLPAAASQLGTWAACALGAFLLVRHGPRLSQLGTAPRLLAAGGSALACALVALGLARAAAALPRLPRAGTIVALGGSLAALAGGGITLRAARSATHDAVSAAAPAAPARGPNVVLIVVDTLRRDVLGCYGDPGGLSPAVDALAARGTVFDGALAAAPWTMPSVASILTGLYPREHGCTDFDRLLPGPVATLPSAFQHAGYHTRAAVGNVLLSHEKGFDRGFDRYDVYGYELEARLVASRLVGELLRLRGRLRHAPRLASPVLLPAGSFPFLRLHLSPAVLDPTLVDRLLAEPLPRDRPSFLYVHFTAPHRPYVMHAGLATTASPPFTPANRGALLELYRGEVAYTDRAVADLLERLRERGVLEDALVVFTSDHGEEFLEHGAWHHGSQLFQEVVGVPLVLCGAGVPAGQRVAAPASLVDLAPTLLELCGVPFAGETSGRSLVPLLHGEQRPPGSVFSETSSRLLSPEHESFGVVRDRWKLVARCSPDGTWEESQAFDLAADPGELHPVDAARTGLADELRAYCQRPPPEAHDDNPSALDRMRALGYVR